MERGTRQGDPMSLSLFNSVLEEIMRQLKPKWRQARLGIQIHGELLQELRFADDILIFGSSRAQVRKMLEDLSVEAKKIGLNIHMGKTKILSTKQPRRGVLAQSTVQVSGQRVEVLPYDGCTLYLGRQVCFQDFHDIEIHHRINKGWAAFAVHRESLCGKHYPLRSRLRLFDAAVSSTVLYGSGAWTMTADRERMLKTTYRQMLRKILGTPRKILDGSLEMWVDWVQRATHAAEHQMEKSGFLDWVTSQRKRKVSLFERTRSSSVEKWSSKILQWEPCGVRSVGRPYKRWSDDI